MTRASENQFPSVLMVNTSNASVSSASPWNSQRLFFDADGTLKAKDSAGSVSTLSGSGITNVDDVVTSADKISFASNFVVSDQGSGDALVNIFVPTGSGSGLSTGTSFPGTPSTGDRYRRSDLDYIVFFYDGTRWLSEEIFYGGNSTPGTAPTSDGAVPVPNPFYNDMDIWVERFEGTSYVVSTNNGSNYWSLKIYKYTGGATPTQVAVYTTAADTAATYTKHTVTVAALVDLSTHPLMQFRWEKTGSPGATIGSFGMYFRLIAT